MDPEQRIQPAVRAILESVGEDPDRNGLEETPERVARSLMELTRGYREDPAAHLDRVFEGEYDDPPADAPRHGIILVRDIPFHSLCEHHILPFHGNCSVAYIPDGKITGLSKIARCVRGFASRLQVQERMTNQVARAMEDRLDAEGVAVKITARHLCMEMRGVRSPGTETVTSAVRGRFYRDDASRAEVFKLMEAE